MEKFLDDKDLPEYYHFINKIQKNTTEQIQNNNRFDLFIILDISGSMNSTSNKFMNIGAGFLGWQYLGGLVGLDKHNITKRFNTRLDEAKKHLVIQIKDLIEENRINKLGLITFNQEAKMIFPLTLDYQKVIEGIKDQEASGTTALYDSIIFAQEQLKTSSNPRMLVMTDGEDNSSKEKIVWQEEWFNKSGLKSTFFTICEGNNQKNRDLAKFLHSKYLAAGTESWFTNSFDNRSIAEGIAHLK